MSAHIKRLQPKDKQVKQELIQQLQFLLEKFPEHENKATSLLWEIKRKNKLNDLNAWTFIMISPEQNLAVVNWLTSKSKRPLNAVKLWALLFDNVHHETGQIMLTRQEIANELKIQSVDLRKPAIGRGAKGEAAGHQSDRYWQQAPRPGHGGSRRERRHLGHQCHLHHRALRATYARCSAHRQGQCEYLKVLREKLYLSAINSSSGHKQIV